MEAIRKLAKVKEDKYTIEMLQILLKSLEDENINDKDIEGNTALHYAVKSNNYMVAKLLLENNADPDVQNNKGDTPLHNIIYTINNSMLYLLFKYADFNIRNNDGNTILHLTTSRMKYDVSYKYTAFSSELVKLESNLFIFNNDNITPFDNALQSQQELPGNFTPFITEKSLLPLITNDRLLTIAQANSSIVPQLVLLFLKNGCNVNTKDNEGLTVFWYLIKNTNVSAEFCQTLQQYYPQPNVNIINSNNNNLLTELIPVMTIGGYIDKVFMLINHTDININHVGNNGTPLMLAIRSGNFECVKLLLEKDCDVNIIFDNMTCITEMIEYIETSEDADENAMQLLKVLISKASVQTLKLKYDDQSILNNLIFYDNIDETVIDIIDKIVDDSFEADDFIINICSIGKTHIFDIIMSRISIDSLHINTLNEALVNAAVSFNFDIFEKLIALGSDINYISGNESILMHVLKIHDNIGLQMTMIDKMLNMNLNINYFDAEGDTAIFYANTATILNKLVLYGADINHINNRNETPLCCAVKLLRHDLVNAILQFGPNLHGISELISNGPYIHYFIDDKISPPAFQYDNTLSRNDYECVRQMSWDFILQYLTPYL